MIINLVGVVMHLYAYLYRLLFVTYNLSLYLVDKVVDIKPIPYQWW